MKRLLALAAGCLVGCSANPQAAHVGNVAGTAPGTQASPQPSHQSHDATIQNVLRKTLPSVVQVWFGDDGDMLTGTIISADGLVLTCAHLPAPVGSTVQIGLSDGRRVPATVLSKLPEPGQSNLGLDLALLQITAPGNWPAAPVAAQSPTRLDEPLLALGFPDTRLYGEDRAADPLYIRLGHPIRDPYQTHPDQLTTSIAGTGGDSGGPLFDLSGQVVGVVHGGDASGAHLSYTRIEPLRIHWRRLVPNKPSPPNPPKAPVTLEPVAPIAAATGPLREAVVEVRSNSRWIALGCIVGEGLILTKASELGPNLTVALAGDFVAIAEIAATDPDRDLALLRLPHAPEMTTNIAPVQWSAGAAAAPGSLLTLATPGHLTPLVGVACFAPRPVAPIAGMIPCEVETAPGGVRVTRVTEEMRAFRLRPPPLPLRVGDLITEIEGTPITDRAAYTKLMFGPEHIGPHPLVSGEPIRVTFKRAETVDHASVILEFCQTPSGQLVRPVSNRYSAFRSAIATDLAVRPEHCGGPIVDSQGRPIGLLIARAPFIESLVLTADEVTASLNTMVAAATKDETPPAVGR